MCFSKTVAQRYMYIADEHSSTYLFLRLFYFRVDKKRYTRCSMAAGKILIVNTKKRIYLLFNGFGFRFWNKNHCHQYTYNTVQASFILIPKYLCFNLKITQLRSRGLSKKAKLYVCGYNNNNITL